MKILSVVVMLMTITAAPVFAQTKEQDRVTDAGNVMREILNLSDDIPQGIIDKADCVVILPHVIKLAFGFG